jgi:ABC-2 type transport system permease protein
MDDFINNYTISAELGYKLSSITSEIFAGQYGFLGQIIKTIYLYLPLLTMGLLSREYGSGSIKLLYSSPVSNRQIVFGKYLSMMVFGLAMIIIVLLYCLYGFIAIKEYDFPLVVTGLLGLYLLICTYSAIGLFMSSLTSYQVVAAMGSFATFFVLEKIDSIWQGLEIIRDITYWLSIRGRCDTFINGLICSEDVLYFILVSGLFISFTTFRLKGIREKSLKYISLIRYTGAFIIIVILGYISTIPSLMVYHDSTRTNENTLTPNSQKILSKLKGKVKITTYVNIFDNNIWEGLPQSINRDLDRYEQYRRFKPDIKMKYKYYYDLPVQKETLKRHNQRYAGMTMEEALVKNCKIFKTNKEIFKPGKDYAQEMPLVSELNRFVRKIETEDGKIAYLRVYDDMYKFPFESQNTAAFKSLVMELPLVGFVTGHEERGVDDFGSRGYFSLAKEKPFRYSLINNGFDFIECNLSTPVDNKISILIISDTKTPFSEGEIKNLNDYISRGGNLVIACDVKRQDIMNSLVERFGVKFLSGQVVEHNKGYEMDLITAVPTKEGKKLAYQFEEIAQMNDGCVTMPGSVAISYEENNEFKYIPVFVSDTVKDVSQTDSVGSWNELKTIDFVDEIAKYNPESGETPGSLTTALALTRKVGEKEQRIVILGDADCFSNSEFSRYRKGINSQNFNMATGMFYWLSDNEVPIDVRRPIPPDTMIYTKESQLIFLNTLYKIVIPSLLALACLFIWLRRKGR